MIGGAVAGRGFHAAALVDGHVHDGRALLHGFDHGLGHKLGRLCTGDEDRADKEIRILYAGGDIEGIGVDSLNALAKDVVNIAEAVDIAVYHGDTGAHAHGNLGSRKPHCSCADNNHMRCRHAGCTANKQAHAAGILGQHFSTDLGGHAAGDLGHGGKQRQGTVVQLHGLIGNAHDGFFQHGLGQGWFGSKVQVGVNYLARTKVFVFRSKRFLDLDNHVAGPGFGSSVHHGSAGSNIFLIGYHAAKAGPFLDQYLVACFCKGMHTGRCHADTEFLHLYFSWQSYFHTSHSFSSRSALLPWPVR